MPPYREFAWVPRLAVPRCPPVDSRLIAPDVADSSNRWAVTAVHWHVTLPVFPNRLPWRSPLSLGSLSIASQPLLLCLSTRPHAPTSGWSWQPRRSSSTSWSSSSWMRFTAPWPSGSPKSVPYHHIACLPQAPLRWSVQCVQGFWCQWPNIKKKEVQCTWRNEEVQCVSL